ncbi:MAG: HAD hydrolase-like protein [Candidatus Ancillula sp.]|jgi:phosphoglycolate phosphatase|nr:HAD hydrolase-like protein [Candidatus Ancillula sp.]
MKKIVLFDLDGTLGDTAPGVISAIKFALKNIGFGELSEAQYNEFIGPPIFDALRAAGVPDDKFEDAIDFYRVAYSTPVLEYKGEKLPGMVIAEPFAGVVELMKKLHETTDYTIITGTSKPEPWARICIERFGIYDYFTPIKHTDISQTGEEEDKMLGAHHREMGTERIEDENNDGIFGASIDKSRVAKSDVLRYALGSCGFDPAVDKAILVGDRHYDVDGAHEIGISAIGCNWGYATPGEIDHADFLVDTPDQVPAILSDFFAA